MMLGFVIYFCLINESEERSRGRQNECAPREKRSVVLAEQNKPRVSTG